MKRWIATLFVCCLSSILFRMAVGQTQPTGPPRAAKLGPHAGRLVVNGDYQFEMVFSNRSVEIFVYDKHGVPTQVPNIRGSVSLAVQGDRRTYRYDLYSPGRGPNSPNRLYLAVDLARVPDRAATVNVALHGLGQRPVEFTTPFQRTLSFAKLAILRQRICPVSGKRLGSMGEPPKVTVGSREVYVCCAGCEAPLKQHPKLHLAKLSQLPEVEGSRR